MGRLGCIGLGALSVAGWSGLGKVDKDEGWWWGRHGWADFAETAWLTKVLTFGSSAAKAALRGAPWCSPLSGWAVVARR